MTFLVVVGCTQGKTRTLHVRESFTIRTVKEIVQDLEGVALTSQRLLYRGMDMQDRRTLRSYNVPPGSTITLTLRLPGGHEVARKTFVDMLQEGARVIIPWFPAAPRWRRAAHGLAIDGRCMNPECEAYNEWVLDNKHFETFDLTRDHAHCPICHKEIRPELPSFNNCYFRIRGIER